MAALIEGNDDLIRRLTNSAHHSVERYLKVGWFSSAERRASLWAGCAASVVALVSLVAVLSVVDGVLEPWEQTVLGIVLGALWNLVFFYVQRWSLKPEAT